MDQLLQDVSFGLRVLRKKPAFSAAIVLIVGIGVGAAATIFSVVEKALLWNENPNVDRWIVIRPFFPRQNLRGNRWSSAEYFDLRAMNDVFERVGAISGIDGTVFIDSVPQRVEATYVTSDMIPMTYIDPMSGRVFAPEDDRPGAPKTTVLTYEFWQDRLHGDPSILGKSLRIYDDYYTVIGIMPPHYGLWSGELYLPFQLNPANQDRSNRSMWVSAIIRRGVSGKQVDARLEQFARSWDRRLRSANPEYEGIRLSTSNIKEAVIAGVRPALLILMAAVALVILISSANVANLLLARAGSRRREMAVRAALGAPRLRIIRQLLTESLLLSFAGGALGAAVAAWGVPAVVALVPADQLPQAYMIRLDGGALLLALAVSTVMGVLFGLAPALSSVRGDLARAIHDGGLRSATSRRSRWTHGALVVSQIALAMIVLAGAGLMIRTYRELLRVDVGYDPRHALTAQLVLPGQRYQTNHQIIAFYRALLERIRAVSGVEGAAIATGRPMMDRTVDIATQDFELLHQEGAKNVPNANLRVVAPDYFSVAGVRVLRGRSLSKADSEEAEPVAVINETAAKLYWPREDAVGQSIRLGAHYGLGADSSNSRTVKIVGVVADARQVKIIDVPVRQEIFFPLAQRPELARTVTLIVRSSLSPNVATGLIRQAVTAIDSDRPVFGFTTLEQALSNSFGPKRMVTALLGFFAFVAMTLAAVALYAVMAFSVSQRTRDVGIRMALGALPSDVLRMFLAEGWRLVVLGLAAGVAGSLVLTRLMSSLVFDISTSDPLTFAVIGVLLASITLAATYFPARRATRIDPVVALRSE